MCQLSPVAFHGDTIFCINHNNQPYTPAKPIVENLGLGWASQSQKLNANRERWGVTIIVIPSESGDQQTLCLPVRKLPAFLASINPKKVRAELRPKIELYQAESDDALWNYWMNGRAERPTSEPSPISKRTDPERKALTAIINTWVGMAPIHYANARAQVNAHFGVTGVDKLTVAQVKEAIQWVQGKIDALPPAAQEELPPMKDKFEAYMERVEAFRARTAADLQRLFEEGLEFVDVQKFGASGIIGFSNIFRRWLEESAVSPIPLVASWQSVDSAMDYTPLSLLKRFERILEERQG